MMTINGWFCWATLGERGILFLILEESPFSPWQKLLVKVCKESKVVLMSVCTFDLMFVFFAVSSLFKKSFNFVGGVDLPKMSDWASKLTTCFLERIEKDPTPDVRLDALEALCFTTKTASPEVINILV